MARVRNQGQFTLTYESLSNRLLLSYGLLYPSIEQTTWASTIPKFREQTAPYWLLCFISNRPSCGVWPFARRTSEAKLKKNGMELKKTIHTEIIINPSINSNNYFFLRCSKYASRIKPGGKWMFRAGGIALNLKKNNKRSEFIYKNYV